MIIFWRFSWKEEFLGIRSIGLQRLQLSICFFIFWAPDQLRHIECFKVLVTYNSCWLSRKTVLSVLSYGYRWHQTRYSTLFYVSFTKRHRHWLPRLTHRLNFLPLSLSAEGPKAKQYRLLLVYIFSDEGWVPQLWLWFKSDSYRFYFFILGCLQRKIRVI